MCRSKKYGVPFILYDRLSNAKSTHLKGKPPTFCIIDLFIDELVNLPNYFNFQDGFDLTGHSWDGILASGFECPSESASIHYKFAIQVEYMRMKYGDDWMTGDQVDWLSVGIVYLKVLSLGEIRV